MYTCHEIIEWRARWILYDLSDVESMRGTYLRIVYLMVWQSRQSHIYIYVYICEKMEKHVKRWKKYIYIIDIYEKGVVQEKKGVRENRIYFGNWDGDLSIARIDPSWKVSMHRRGIAPKKSCPDPNYSILVEKVQKCMVFSICPLTPISRCWVYCIVFLINYDSPPALLVLHE